MKDKAQKRKEALERLKASTWEKSRAFRLKTKTQEVWQEEKLNKIQELTFR